MLHISGYEPVQNIYVKTSEKCIISNWFEMIMRFYVVCYWCTCWLTGCCQVQWRWYYDVSGTWTQFVWIGLSISIAEKYFYKTRITVFIQATWLCWLAKSCKLFRHVSRNNIPAKESSWYSGIPVRRYWSASTSNKKFWAFVEKKRQTVLALFWFFTE